MENTIEVSAQKDLVGRLELLQAEHRELDAKIIKLGQQAYLSADDQLELAGLKKLKLKKKDEIFLLKEQLGIDP
ncbi:MAG TPA: DUF465 domain-containing protein [Myxococcota bacterium]|jgi:hypothetical protein|nr:MAG: hypothetical protein BWX66_02098 [Deltaproteobacteria bacterium ADurb.Bin058]HOE81868.1 DUF465 domain-containing protein [Myxococcota bacterium]HON24410.1 DUF465 domain-containing protein [Myxococcota bacterium]HOS61236.1 DUF465 domain-containing protein [Myxococcota bacterium]HPC91152.1 DUF465 domain-containing protein [Myxococcota bacterium]